MDHRDLIRPGSKEGYLNWHGGAPESARACGYGSTFLQMFDEGGEDYSLERKSWLRKNLHEISREIRGLKKTGPLLFFTTGRITGKNFPLRMPSSKKQGGSHSDCQQNPGCG